MQRLYSFLGTSKNGLPNKRVSIVLMKLHPLRDLRKNKVPRQGIGGWARPGRVEG